MYEEYLGVSPDNHQTGPLQDPHWSGSIPGFINYTLGHGVLAAQVWEAAQRDLDMSAHIRAGDFEPITDWMTEHIHRHGQRYKTQELIERATGQELKAEPFLQYIESKYSDLYRL